MLKRFSMAAIAAVMTVSTVFGTTIISSAEELTQIQNQEDVDYGNHGADFSKEDLALLESMFDADYYSLSNPDVFQQITIMLGDNYSIEEANKLLFKHFATCGLFEGRSLSESFNVMAFASAYSDLKDAFGKDILSYYKYAATHDLQAEGRTITTVEAAAKAGITVTSVTNSEVAITPQLYYMCEKLGTKDLQIANNKIKAIMPVSDNNKAQSTASTYDPSYVPPVVTFEDLSAVKPSDFVDLSHVATIQPVVLEEGVVNQYGHIELTQEQRKNIADNSVIGTLKSDENVIRLYYFKDANGNQAIYSDENGTHAVAVSKYYDEATRESEYERIQDIFTYTKEENENGNTYEFVNEAVNEAGEVLGRGHGTGSQQSDVSVAYVVYGENEVLYTAVTGYYTGFENGESVLVKSDSPGTTITSQVDCNKPEGASE
jgi:hypothetical protein